MIIYKIVNLVNGKIYIGKCQGSLEERFNKHIKLAESGEGYFLHRAIRKYKPQNFYCLILKDGIRSKNKLNYWEKYYIALLKCRDQKYGYNIHIGGQGGDNISTHPDNKKIREKLSRIHLLNAKRGKDSHRYIHIEKKIQKKIINEYTNYHQFLVGDIIKKYNITQDLLQRVLKENKIQRKRGARYRFLIKKENIKKLIKNYIKKCSLPQLQNQTNLSCKLIKSLLMEYEVWQEPEKIYKIKIKTPITVKLKKPKPKKIKPPKIAKLKKPKKEFFSKYQINKIITLYNKGKGATYISKKFKTGEDRIRGLLKRNNVKIRTNFEANNKSNIKLIIKSKNNKIIKKFNSVKAALISVGIIKNNGQIASVIAGRCKTYKGYKWQLG